MKGKILTQTFLLALTSFTTYTQKVLKATAQIPLGYVTSYGSIAKAAGGGPRAVGNIMASNPFAPIVPATGLLNLILHLAVMAEA